MSELKKKADASKNRKPVVSNDANAEESKGQETADDQNADDQNADDSFASAQGNQGSEQVMPQLTWEDDGQDPDRVDI